MGGRGIQFTIPGRVGGKGRPRFTVIAGHARAYTPAKTVSTEAMVREIAARAMNGAALLDGPLALEVAIFINPPASWSKRKRAEAIHPTGKPDLDNIGKLIGDALNGIIWKDDSQLSALTIRRRFNGEAPEHVYIRVTELSPAISAAVAA